MTYFERVHHDEDTLRKVYDALEQAGISKKKAPDVVANMLNRGILFRERMPDSDEPTPDHPLLEHFSTKGKLERSSVVALMDAYRAFAYNIYEELPPGPESDEALRKLLESMDAALRTARVLDFD